MFNVLRSSTQKLLMRMLHELKSMSCSLKSLENDVKLHENKRRFEARKMKNNHAKATFRLLLMALLSLSFLGSKWFCFEVV